MSAIFCIKNEKIHTAPYGYQKFRDYNAFFFYQDRRLGRISPLDMSSDGKFFYPEDYANKREYLKTLKLQGGPVFSDYYRLTDETVALLKSLPVGTIFALLDITEYDDDIKYPTKTSVLEISNRSAFKEDTFYKLG